MDKVKACELEKTLKGKTIEGWKVASLINFGKSAAVYLATKSDKKAALKVFDDELIAKYGDEAQLARIERELQLVGHEHPNLVRLVGGGFDKISKNHYILMEYLDGPNLKQCLQEIPSENIALLISQLADGARFLESIGLSHRDIKPENIVVTDNYKRLILLDFGVLRPIGEAGLTDDDGIQSFIGTLQYSSPEFLIRQEEDTVEGWRALTFYQIGAVLHDLLMKTEIFADMVNPYARLVMAVQNDTPTIHNSAVPSYLVDLARACLSKVPAVRTQILSWDSFSPPEMVGEIGDTAKTRVTNRQATLHAIETVDQMAADDQRVLLHSVIETIKIKVRAIRNSNTTSLPPVSVTGQGCTVRVCFGPSVQHGLSSRLTIIFCVEILDVSINAVSLSVWAFFGKEVTGEAATQKLIFQGVSSANSIGGALEKCVYIFVEQAQLIEDSGDGTYLSTNDIEG